MGDLFLLVLAGHLLGDFVMQTDWQASNKESSWRADLAHVLTYHVPLAALVLPVWHDWPAVWFLGISAATHAFIDRRWPTRLARLHGQQGLCHPVLGSDRYRPGPPPQHPGDQLLLVVTMRKDHHAWSRHLGTFLRS
jgi:Protein of unknown function (DUF3307)